MEKIIYLVCCRCTDDPCEHEKAFASREDAEKLMASLKEVTDFYKKCTKEADEQVGEKPLPKWSDFFTNSDKMGDWVGKWSRIYYKLLAGMPEHIKALNEQYENIYDVWIEEITYVE